MNCRNTFCLIARTLKILVFSFPCKWFLDVEGKEGLGTTHWWDVHFGAVIAGGGGQVIGMQRVNEQVQPRVHCVVHCESEQR